MKEGKQPESTLGGEHSMDKVPLGKLDELTEHTTHSFYTGGRIVIGANSGHFGLAAMYTPYY